VSSFIACGPLANELIARGLVPEHCRILSIEVGVSGAVLVRYEKYIDEAELVKFGDAFMATAEKLLKK
jgi:hypothetical protein